MTDELHLRLYRLDRPTKSIDLAAGDGTFEFDPIPLDMVVELEQVSVSGPSIGGATVTLYVNDPVPENFIGSVTLGAADLGTTFQDARPWLYGGERLVVVVDGSGGTRAAAKVWQRLYRQARDLPASAAALAPVLEPEED